MAQFLDKIFNVYVLVAINILLICVVEFVETGFFSAAGGFLHKAALFFVALVIFRSFSEYSFKDPILKGFLNIQIFFFLILGSVHIYEYIKMGRGSEEGVTTMGGGMSMTSGMTMADSTVVVTSVALLYFLWLVGNVLAQEFVSRIYHKRSFILLSIFTLLATLITSYVFARNFFDASVPNFSPRSYDLLAAITIIFGFFGVVYAVKLKNIMPIFERYNLFAIPAVFMVVIAALFGYSGYQEFFTQMGIGPTQTLYFSHFLIYMALSSLFIGLGRMKRPTGIYSEA